MARFDEIPVLVKHVTLAILAKSGSRGPAAFERAFGAALSSLKTGGYLSDARIKPVRVSLTSKGQKRDRVHRREGPAKGTRFDLLYETYQLKLGGGKPARREDTEKLPDGQRE